MEYKKLVEAITTELHDCLLKTDNESIERAIALIHNAKRVFVAGAGRSGLEASAFTMRLMHIGYTAHRVGEVTTPSIMEGDLFVVCSGSGETTTMIEYAKIAKKNHAKVLLFTTKEESSLASIADEKIVIHAKAAKNNANDNASSIQPMSNLFVQSLCLIMDIIIIRLMQDYCIDETKMKHNHANIE